MIEVEYKIPTLEDAEILSQFSGKCFCDTFAHLYPKEDLDEFLSAKYSKSAVEKEIQNPDLFIVTASKGDELIGYAMGGPMGLPYETAMPNSYELIRLYVSEAAKGKGVALKLYEEILSKSYERAAPEFYLGVYSYNLRAQSFYKKQGFEIVGQYFFPVGKTMDDERIMRLNPDIYARRK